MRCLMTVCAALAILAIPALAQPPRGGGFGQMGIGQLLMNKSVQEELKLDKEAVEKITAAINKVREDMKDDLAKLREQDTPREERQAINKKLTEATTKAVADLVKPEQMTRVKQIQLQVQGVNAFNNADVQKALSLTDDQKEDVKKLIEETGQKVRELFQDAQGDQDKIREMRTKIAAMTKENMEKVTKSLKPEQQKALKELLGAPFELKIERPGR
jgi:hypothetical protein